MRPANHLTGPELVRVAEYLPAEMDATPSVEITFPDRSVWENDRAARAHLAGCAICRARLATLRQQEMALAEVIAELREGPEATNEVTVAVASAKLDDRPESPEETARIDALTARMMARLRAEVNAGEGLPDMPMDEPTEHVHTPVSQRHEPQKSASLLDAGKTASGEPAPPVAGVANRAVSASRSTRRRLWIPAAALLAACLAFLLIRALGRPEPQPVPGTRPDGALGLPVTAQSPRESTIVAPPIARRDDSPPASRGSTQERPSAPSEGQLREPGATLAPPDSNSSLLHEDQEQPEVTRGGTWTRPRSAEDDPQVEQLLANFAQAVNARDSARVRTLFPRIATDTLSRRLGGGRDGMLVSLQAESIERLSPDSVEARVRSTIHTRNGTVITERVESLIYSIRRGPGGWVIAGTRLPERR